MSAPFHTAPALALDTLAATLTSVNEAYLRLLTQPDSWKLCPEAAKTVRRIAHCYSRALIAVTNAQAESELEEDWEDEEGKLMDEELEE